MRTASLPMYRFAETQAAVLVFLAHLKRRLITKGLVVEDVVFDRERRPVPDGIGPQIFFTQICGYPLFKRFRDQGHMLATPSYSFPGCSEGAHCAFFMVRAEDPAVLLEDMRERVFGCNSLLSNSGMNLPRLSLARVAGGRRFFSSVVMTGGHLESLASLREGAIDLCSIDNVTWGFFHKLRSAEASRFRILDRTVSSPSLPFVTSVETPARQIAALRDSIDELMTDVEMLNIRESLGLRGVEEPKTAAYERLADFEREAAELGYAEII